MRVINTADLVKLFNQHLRLEVETGLLYWKVSRRGRTPGKPAGGKSDHRGYIRIRIDGQNYYAHFVIWVMTTETVPPKGSEIDHEDRDKSNNRPSNLRLLTRSQNNMNRGPVKGYERVPSGRYAVRCGGRYIGTFDTEAEAATAYQQAVYDAYH